MNIWREKRPNFPIYLEKKLTSLAYDEILILHRSPFLCVCELAFSYFFFLRPFEKAVFPIPETYSYGVLSFKLREKKVSLIFVTIIKPQKKFCQLCFFVC